MYYPVRVEEARVKGYCMSHHVNPFVMVAVVCGDYFFLKFLVEIIGIFALIIMLSVSRFCFCL